MSPLTGFYGIARFLWAMNMSPLRGCWCRRIGLRNFTVMVRMPARYQDVMFSRSDFTEPPGRVLEPRHQGSKYHPQAGGSGCHLAPRVLFWESICHP